MNILGLDVSTKCGYVLTTENLGEAEILEKGVIATEKKDYPYRPDRWAYHRDCIIEDVIKRRRVNLAVIEGYAYGNSNTLATLVEIGTTIRLGLIDLDIPYIEVTPNGLKKFITGKGSGKKSLILLNVYKRWGIEIHNEDEADAYALCQFGRAILGIDTGVPKINLEALEPVKKSQRYILDKLT